MKIIDGYNLIGAAREFGLDLSQEDKEERLLRLLVSFRGRSRLRERLLVVFDGSYGRLARGPRRYTHAGIDVEWSLGESADALIALRVKRAARPKELTVVTSDAELLRTVASFGASGLRSAAFLERVAQAQLEAPEAEKPADPSAEEVDDWLERFKRLD